MRVMLRNRVFLFILTTMIFATGVSLSWGEETSRRRSLATSGQKIYDASGRVINNQTVQKKTDTNSNANKSNDLVSKKKATSTPTVINQQNRPQNNRQNPQNMNRSSFNNRERNTGAGKNVASKGQLKMVDQAMIEVLRTRKVDYDEDKMGASPTVIVLNSKRIKPDKSLIERESALIRQEKEEEMKKKMNLIPQDIFEFLGDLE